MSTQSSFPISNSRLLPLPSPLMTGGLTHYSGSTLSGITTPQQYHSANSDHPTHGPSHHFYYPQPHSNTADSYFPSADSRRSTRSDSKPSLHSISSILQSSGPADVQSENSSSSNSPMYNYPGCYWAASPTGTVSTTPRTSSLSSTTMSAYGGNSGEYASDASSYTTREYNNQMKDDAEGKRKIRSSPRTTVNPQSSTGKDLGINNKGDEYDVLGRKKPKTPRTPMSWDPQDDILLKELKEEQRLGWKEIATHFPGRTSHACQFRWRRLVSGTLKYYQGHRRPPVVTTTSSSFASEMAASTIPNHAASAPTTPSTARYPAPVSPATSPQHSQHYGYDRAPYHHRPSFSGATFSLPSPASSSPQQQLGSPMAMPGTPCTPPPPHTPTFHGANHYGNYPTHPHYFPSTTEDEDEEDNWTAEEDALLMDRKLCFDEVNVLLRGRREPEIWQRMGKLRWGARGGSESSASGESDVGFSPIDSRGTIKLPPVPAGRILRSHSIQR
ncbi:hypothetical protein DFH27DRAFT_212724 [Peziza echinospora]|nr:hypothetical protein DFH27DRAFT_212724 [Peziza echinospora]